MPQTGIHATFSCFPALSMVGSAATKLEEVGRLPRHSGEAQFAAQVAAAAELADAARQASALEALMRVHRALLAAGPDATLECLRRLDDQPRRIQEVLDALERLAGGAKGGEPS